MAERSEELRSVEIHLTNNAGRKLRINDYRLKNGTWFKNGTPPDVIAHGATVIFGSESSSPGSGTEGMVKYSIEHVQGQPVILNWSNPYMGGNSFDVYIPNGFKFSQSAGSENNTIMNFTITMRDYYE